MVESARSPLDEVFRFGQTVAGSIRYHNVFNNAAVLAENLSYGSTYLKPTAILAGRLFKFGAQFDF